MIDVYTFKILNFINSLHWATYDEICSYIERDDDLYNNFTDERLIRILDYSCDYEIISETDYNHRTYIISPNHKKPNELSFYKFKLNAKGKEVFQEYYNYYILPKSSYDLNIESITLAKQSLTESKTANELANKSLNESKIANKYADKSLKTSKWSNTFTVIGIIISIIALIVSIYACHK